MVLKTEACNFIKKETLAQVFCCEFCEISKNVSFARLVFSRFFDLRGNLGNVKEKPTRKTCFSREKKRLTPRIYLAKFCKATL